MATISKRDDKWRAQVRKRGYPHHSSHFSSKSQALRWAREVESQMERRVFISHSEAERTTIAELFDRYLKEVTPKKASANRERLRIAFLKRHFGCRFVSQLRPPEFAEYRDARLRQGRAGATVIKELNTLSHVIDNGTTRMGHLHF